MSVKIDLTGRQFGKLTAIKSTTRRDKYRSVIWKCRCECGRIKYASTHSLNGRQVTSCGCKIRFDLKGKTFGRLTVLRKQKKRKGTDIAWLCRCQCGEKTSVRTKNLTSLTIQSCGCYKRERTSQTHTIHGDAGKNPSKLYMIWHQMKKRCLNNTDKSYQYYGGRGIKVCKQWYDYRAFKKWALVHGYRVGLEIDRIDNNGNYEARNCRWVTRKENLRNTSRTRWFTINGITKSLPEWCEIYNVSYVESVASRC